MDAEIVGHKLSQAIEVKRKLEDLKNDPGFLYLNSQVQMQVDSLQKTVLFDPCTTIDRCVAQEYKKGQLEGRLSWGETLEATIASLDFDIYNLKEELEHDSDDGTTASNSAP